MQRITPFIFRTCKTFYYFLIWVFTLYISYDIIIYMDKISHANYNEMLLNAIPFLKSLPNKSGGEGTAYFLDDKFIIKKYNYSQNWRYFDYAFEEYCEELMRYADLGYNIPKIYAYLKLPNVNYYTGRDKNLNNYYILEERKEGRHLFAGYLSEMYPLVQDVFDYRQYKTVLANPDEHLDDFKELVKIFIKDYIKMNEIIEAMPEDELGSFVLELYKMYMEGEHSVPDVHPSNVLYDGKGLSIIDNIMTFGYYKNKSKSAVREDFVRDLLNLFYYNNQIFDLSHGALFGLGKKTSVDFSYLKRKNYKVCKAAIIKTVNVMNKYCDNPEITSAKARLALFSALDNVLKKDDNLQVLNQLNMPQL